MVLAAVQACEDKKAIDTRVLELDASDAALTDYFIISSGSNPRQTQAIAEEIELRMKREFSTYANSVEGYKTGEWILLDYVDFVVHVFLEERRAFYDIERLRKTARTVGQEELRKRAAKQTASAAEKPAKANRPAKKSPAKKNANKPAGPKTRTARSKRPSTAAVRKTRSRPKT